MRDNWPLEGTSGDWCEYVHSDVVALIMERAGSPDLSKVQALSRRIEAEIEDAKHAVASILSVFLDHKQDGFISEIKEKIGGQKLLSERAAMRAALPSGQISSQDLLAMSQGLRLAPHQEVAIKAGLLNLPATVASGVSRLMRQAGAHLSRLERRSPKVSPAGTTVFIGHGRNLQWMALRNFIESRLQLPHDEFNRVPVAGVTNISRLTEMLEHAAIAFVILTAEDELRDGSMQARMNVIHEVGLFQGRLGFSRAVVMLEEGCEEFTNIQGLGQIRFPPGRIDAAFEDVRRVLEREGLLHPSFSSRA